MIWALHGAVGRAADWLGFSADVRKDSAVAAAVGEVRRLDLWRFLDCCPMPLGKLGDTLAGEIARVDPDPILVAYSMGGRLALHALLAKPQMWRGAVIVSAHPGLSSELEREDRREKDGEWSAMALKGEWSDFLKKWEGQGVLNGAGEMPDRRVLKGRRASVARSFVDWSLGAQADLTDRLHEIECPVLWVTGEDDVKFTKLAKKAVAEMPHAEHQIIAGCGHRVPWEQSEVFSKHCRHFIQDLVKG